MSQAVTYLWQHLCATVLPGSIEKIGVKLSNRRKAGPSGVPPFPPPHRHRPMPYEYLSFQRSKTRYESQLETILLAAA